MQKECQLSGGDLQLNRESVTPNCTRILLRQTLCWYFPPKGLLWEKQFLRLLIVNQWLRMQIHHPNYIQLLLPHEKLSRWSIRLELAKRQCIQRQLMAAGCYAGWVAPKEGPLTLTPTLLYSIALLLLPPLLLLLLQQPTLATRNNTCSQNQHRVGTILNIQLNSVRTPPSIKGGAPPIL